MIYVEAKRRRRELISRSPSQYDDHVNCVKSINVVYSDAKMMRACKEACKYFKAVGNDSEIVQRGIVIYNSEVLGFARSPRVQWEI